MIRYGAGDRPRKEYKSVIYYHNNQPMWNELIKVNLAPDVFRQTHIRFYFYHCSSSSDRYARVWLPATLACL